MGAAERVVTLQYGYVLQATAFRTICTIRLCISLSGYRPPVRRRCPFARLAGLSGTARSAPQHGRYAWALLPLGLLALVRVRVRVGVRVSMGLAVPWPVPVIGDRLSSALASSRCDW